jgi:serine-type D-Ala-D-Ala carboxypeptidase (penicillin-binding protein 5/6)
MRIILATLILLTAFIPHVGASDEYVSALLMEVKSGQILFEDNVDESWIPASVVKLMLLLLADEAFQEGRVNSGTIFTSSRYAKEMGGSQVYLAEGDETDFQKLIEAVAVGSANDAAVTVAEGIYGSVPATIVAMNAKCEELGMTSTVYTNVTGLPENHGKPDNHTTARDQAILAREVLLRHPGVLDWTGKIWTRFRPGLDMGTTNTMMKVYDGMDGLKTGYHAKGRSNLVATAERDGRRFIAVVLGAPGPKVRNGVVERLLDSGFSDWAQRTALRRGDGLGVEFPVKRTWRGKLRVRAGEDLVFLAKPEDIARVSIEFENPDALAAPFDKGEVVGRIVVKLDGKVLSSVPALADKRMRASWLSWPARGGSE